LELAAIGIAGASGQRRVHGLFLYQGRRIIGLDRLTHVEAASADRTKDHPRPYHPHRPRPATRKPQPRTSSRLDAERVHLDYSGVHLERHGLGYLGSGLNRPKGGHLAVDVYLALVRFFMDLFGQLYA